MPKCQTMLEGEEDGEANIKTGKHNKQCDKSDNDDNFKGDNNNRNNKKKQLSKVYAAPLHLHIKEW